MRRDIGHSTPAPPIIAFDEGRQDYTTFFLGVAILSSSSIARSHLICQTNAASVSAARVSDRAVRLGRIGLKPLVTREDPSRISWQRLCRSQHNPLVHRLVLSQSR